MFWPVLTSCTNEIYMLRSKIEDAHWAGKNNRNALWHYRSSYNVKLRVATVLKQPQRVVVWEKQPQCEMSFKLNVYTFSNLLLRNTCNVGLLKNNGEAHLVLQELLELHFIFFETTFALFIDAIPLTVAAYKSLLTSIHYHWGWPKRQWTWGHIMYLDEVVVSSCEFIASIQPLK